MTDRLTIDGQDIPDELPDHPEEKRLRKAEIELATTIRGLARKAGKALEAHDRVDAAVLLHQLAMTCEGGRQAEVQAIRDQMAAAAENPHSPHRHDG